MLEKIELDTINILNIWSDDNLFMKYKYLYYKDYMIIVNQLHGGKITFSFVSEKNILSNFRKYFEFKTVMILSYDVNYFNQKFPKINYYLSNLPSEILVLNKKELEKDGYEIRYDYYIAKKVEHIVRQEKIKKILETT